MCVVNLTMICTLFTYSHSAPQSTKVNLSPGCVLTALPGEGSPLHFRTLRDPWSVCAREPLSSCPLPLLLLRLTSFWLPFSRSPTA